MIGFLIHCAIAIRIGQRAKSFGKSANEWSIISFLTFLGIHFVLIALLGEVVDQIVLAFILVIVTITITAIYWNLIGNGGNGTVENSGRGDIEIFIFKPTNDLLGKAQAIKIEAIPSALEAFSKSHLGTAPYSYAEAIGKTWTIISLNPFEIREGRISPPLGHPLGDKGCE